MKRIVIFILAFFLFLTVSPSVSQATAGGHSGGRSVHSSSRSGGGLHSYSGSRGGSLGTYPPHYYGGTRSPLGTLVSGLFFVGVAGFSIFQKKFVSINRMSPPVKIFWLPFPVTTKRNSIYCKKSKWPF